MRNNNQWRPCKEEYGGRYGGRYRSYLHNSGPPDNSLAEEPNAKLSDPTIEEKEAKSEPVEEQVGSKVELLDIDAALKGKDANSNN